jgi:hypothetical protein
MTTGNPGSTPLLEAILNLSRFHREHEKFYATAPLETAVQLHRHARTLLALADRWSTAVPSTRKALSPYEGADDLNSPSAIELDGVLFLEGEGRPPELTGMIDELRGRAEDFARTGEWLATAMAASWDMAGALVDIDALADVLGERHRIISNDWLAAHMNVLMGHLLVRAADMLERIDFTPAALRRDLAGTQVAPDRLYATAEVIARAADLCSESAGLVHDNERRWRVFRAGVEKVVDRVTTVTVEEEPHEG